MKRIYLIGLAVIVVAVIVIFLNSDFSSGGMEEQVAQQGDTVRVEYWLTVDGEQIDTSEGREPLEFTLGAGQVIPGFDKAVTGMKVGEEKSVELSGADAYTAGPLAGKVLNFRIILVEIV